LMLHMQIASDLVPHYFRKLTSAVHRIRNWRAMPLEGLDEPYGPYLKSLDLLVR